MIRRLLLTFCILLICSPVFAATDYTAHANNMMSLLMRADENPLTDSSGEGNTGALKAAGEPNYTTDVPTGYVEGSYDFDGTDDYVSVTDDPTLDIIGDLTVTFWCLIDTISADEDIMFDKEDSGTGDEPFLVSVDDDGTAYWRYYHHENGGDYNAVLTFTNQAVTTGAWQHIAYVRNATNRTIDLYINGVDVEQETWTAGDDPGPSSSNLKIGQATNDARAYDGHLKEVGLFNTVLTSTQINEIMDFGLDGSLDVATTKFRKTLSSIGTGTGKRQMVGN